MVQVLVGVLVIALLVIIGLFIYQRQTLKKLQDYAARLAALPTKQIDQRLDKERVGALMGESLRSFTRLRERYDKDLLPAIKRAEGQVEDLSLQAKTTNLFSIGEAVKELGEVVNGAEETCQQLQQTLNQLDQSVKSQEQALTKLRKQYNDFGRTLDEQAFQFGDSRVQLHDQLVGLQEKFERFAKVANQGDHEAAQEILDELEGETSDFAHLLKEVPALYKPLYAVFPDQLSELGNGYQELKQEHYNFTEDNIPAQLTELGELQKQALGALRVLDLAPVKATNDHLAKAIDHLYEVMQTELDARPQVEKRLPLYEDHLDHAEQQNRQLLNELERLSISYTLNHNELADARGLGEQLRQLRKALMADKGDRDAHTAIDSQLLERLKKGEGELVAIEKQQQSINQGVADLRADEQRARAALQRFATNLKATKRQVESLNLPGIPQEYLDYFFVVSDEVKKLSQAMNQPQINMEEITKQLLVVQEDSQTLQERTDELRDSAELTERMIQYAHRLSVDHEQVAPEIEKARRLFNEYKYTDSLETIGTAIEEAEPGAFKRLEQAYYDEVGATKAQ